MIDKSSREKSTVICPHCYTERIPGEIEWLYILDDLDMFGKTVLFCPVCRKWFTLREIDCEVEI